MSSDTLKQMINMMYDESKYLIYETPMDKYNLEKFSEIYRDGLWGQHPMGFQRFYSGPGSHDPLLINPYVESVSKFLSKFDHKPDVVDLGCGDFNVGSRYRSLCNSYIACDVVPELIEHNRKVFGHLSVDFKVLDLAHDELPLGDIVFVRQVFQHLSNASIKLAVEKIKNTFRYLVLTEHVPSYDAFIPNLDKMSGADIRIDKNSGVVLTKSPFNLVPLEEIEICKVYGYGGLIKTTLYKLT